MNQASVTLPHNYLCKGIQKSSHPHLQLVCELLFALLIHFLPSVKFLLYLLFLFKGHCQAIPQVLKLGRELLGSAVAEGGRGQGGAVTFTSRRMPEHVKCKAGCY